MNYHFKNNNIYYGDILVAEDMIDATKRLNGLEKLFTGKFIVLEEYYQPVGKIRMVLSKSALLVDRNSDEFKLIMCIASELGIDPDVLIARDDVEDM